VEQVSWVALVVRAARVAPEAQVVPGEREVPARAGYGVYSSPMVADALIKQRDGIVGNRCL
jgi:hypothetical protein